MSGHGGSAMPVSSQTGPHPALARRLDRHMARPWQAPVAEHNHAAFARADQWRCQLGPQRALILDSGCGTGLSSVQLGEAHPEALILGLDQSEARLNRAPNRFRLPPNVLLLQADCGDFWRLARSRGWHLQRHYLLYPNPWPKPAHLGRRWHGHPVFPDLVALGGVLEVRSNWRLYLEEMALALSRAGRRSGEPEAFTTDAVQTDFEHKYYRSGHPLYRLCCDLDEDQPTRASI
jgi:tRNA (guanine-N7-)-methyltransferase